MVSSLCIVIYLFMRHFLIANEEQQFLIEPFKAFSAVCYTLKSNLFAARLIELFYELLEIIALNPRTKQFSTAILKCT